MNNIKEVKLQISQSNQNRSWNFFDSLNFKRTAVNQIAILKKKSERKARTQMIQQRQQRQTLELKAKTHLFEESQGHNQHEIKKSYSRPKKKSDSIHKFIRQQEGITAFDDGHESNRKKFGLISTQNDLKPEEKKPKNKGLNNHELPNSEVYWNKKNHHVHPTPLRPAILNPTISVQLNKVESELLISPKSKHKYSINELSTSQANFEAVVKEFTRKTKEIYNNHDVNRYKSKQKTKKMSLAKRLVKLRSKSTNMVQEYQRNQIISQIEKITSRCEFDLQIKCLNSQKAMLTNQKGQILKNNQDLQEKIKTLITKQNKGKTKDSKQAKEEHSDNSEDKIFQKKAHLRMQKLSSIHNRSKSCIVTNFKGPENKKLKISNILNKLAKFKNEELEKRQKNGLQRQDIGSTNKSLQFLKVNLLVNDNAERERFDAHLLRINQECFDQSKKGLINSIKNYCREKNNSKLPFVNNLMKNSSSIHPVE